MDLEDLAALLRHGMLPRAVLRNDSDFNKE